MFNKENCFSEMQSSINAFSVELKNIRTGRVSPDILKTIVVDSYGSKTPLTQLSNINNLDNMTLNVNIWDSSLVKTIEKTILDSNLGVNPQTDGSNILLKFPELTAERRKELAKIISEVSEKFKISIRGIRRKYLDQIKNFTKELSSFILQNEEFIVDENNKCFVRLEKFNDSSIDILIYCFTKSNDWEKYLKTKENLAIFIKECVENNNLSFAFPSQSIYVEKK